MSLIDPSSASPPHRSSRATLFGGVATAALTAVAGVAVFGLFYLVGAAVGLVVLAAAGAALVAGLAWLALKSGRKAAVST